MPCDAAVFEEVPIFSLLDADERAVLAEQVAASVPTTTSGSRTGDGRTAQCSPRARTSHVLPTSPRRTWKVASKPGSAPK
jgi:hypothetical protein